MAPRRKPVTDPAKIVDNWHLRPNRGQTGRGRVSRASKPIQDRRSPSRPLEPVVREFPRLAAIYEALPAYSLDGPPETPAL